MIKSKNEENNCYKNEFISLQYNKKSKKYVQDATRELDGVSLIGRQKILETVRDKYHMPLNAPKYQLTA